jgi:hypothetical protein
MSALDYEIRNLGTWNASGNLRLVSQYELNIVANRVQKLADKNAFLKANLKALFNKQVQHTQEMWELINEIFDREDNNTPREK